MNLFSVFSVQYLVVIQIVRQTADKQFMGRIWNDSGDNTYTKGKRATVNVFSFYPTIELGTIPPTQLKKTRGTDLGRGKPAALRYRVKVDSREAV